MMDDSIFYWIGAALLGVAVAVGGIFNRYQRAPVQALMSIPAMFYLFFNALGSVGALALINVFGWEPAATTSSANMRIIQMLAAGFGGLVFLRSTLTIGIGKQAISVGVSQFLQNILSAIGRAMDRKEAERAQEAMGKIMIGISFARVYNTLPEVCFSRVEVPPQEKRKIARMIVQLHHDEGWKDHMKLILLGDRLSKLVGEDVLKRAVGDLRQTLIQSEKGS